MGFVEAATAANSFSENFDPYSTSWDMGKNIYFAQTLALAEGSRLFRCGFLACAHTPADPWRHSVRLTDINRKPLSVDLYMDEGSSKYSAVCGAARPRYETHDWPFPYFPAGTYAIVLARPGSPDTQRAKIFGITPAFTSATKKTWRSLDYGVTWSEIANTQLCHGAYGYIAPPAPPPPAAIGNWYITNIVQTQTATGYQIVVTTNVPAHLFLRWTLAPPGQHIKTVMERGAPVQKLIDQCFVATNDINQAEAGDTLTHTFLVEPWPYCQTRWFYFWGTRVMYRQPSTSPIYEKHNVAPTIITPCQSPPGTTPGGQGVTWCQRVSSCIYPTITFKLTTISFWLRSYAGWPYPPTSRAQLWTASAGKPVTLLDAGILTTVPPLNPYTCTQVDFPINGYTLQKNTQYCIVYYSDYAPAVGAKGLYICKRSPGTTTCDCTNPYNTVHWTMLCQASGYTVCNCAGGYWVNASGALLAFKLTGAAIP